MRKVNVRNNAPEPVIGKVLTKKKMILSVAESCTGGLIANRITDVPGSSKYFDSAVVTYSNQSKVRELGVKKELIKKYGAVSSQVAIAMAKGMLKKSGSSVALAVTGIAGPAGGTKKKPVGLVFIAVAAAKSARCIKKRFIGSRRAIKRQAAAAALAFLRQAI